jgi:hypothetical protein
MREALEAVYRREEIKPLPMSSLVYIASILEEVSKAAHGQLSLSEIAFALSQSQDGDVMVYDGSEAIYSIDLCPAIDGNPLEENHGWNLRADLFCDFLNTRYWDDNFGSEDVIVGKRRIPVRQIMVSRGDGMKIMSELWLSFYPESSLDELSRRIARSQRRPRKDCFPIIDLAKAAVEASMIACNEISLAEATDALVSAYGGEMLFDGTCSALLAPYSECLAPLSGTELSQKMTALVMDIFNYEWWQPSNAFKNTESLEKATNLMLLNCDGPPVWERMRGILFAEEKGDVKGFWELIAIVKVSEKQTKGDDDQAAIDIGSNVAQVTADQRATQKEEIAYLRAELRSETDKSAALTAERDSLKADALEGKARSTALKVIGGLLIDGYRMDIHAVRLEGIGEVVKDLDKAGVRIEPKTLSGYIKEAANLIEPKKKS